MAETEVDYSTQRPLEAFAALFNGFTGSEYEPGDLPINNFSEVNHDPSTVTCKSNPSDGMYAGQMLRINWSRLDIANYGGSPTMESTLYDEDEQIRLENLVAAISSALNINLQVDDIDTDVISWPDAGFPFSVDLPIRLDNVLWYGTISVEVTQAMEIWNLDGFHPPA